MKLLSLTLPFLLLCGCGTPSTDPAASQGLGTDSMAVPGSAVVDLASHGLPLLLAAPDKQLTGGLEPTIVWKDETGTLEVKAGDHFGLTITEEPGDLARLKASLDRDLLRKHTILRETPELLVYRSEFPDDPSLVFIHFYQVARAGDRAFVVQDIDGKPFNQQDIERMVASISPKQPA